MAEDQTAKVAPEGIVPPSEPAELADEDLQKVSGGISEIYQSRHTGVRLGGGVDESAPVETEPAPAPVVRNILTPR